MAIVFLSRNDKTHEKPYILSDGVAEIPGTITYTNDDLKKGHCLDGICVLDVTFYYIDDEGRLECTILNQSSKEESGYLKLVFGEDRLTVVYRNLSPGKMVKTISKYHKLTIPDKDDYVLEKLTDEEISKIKVSKK